ncbi:MAG: hypothetical protein U5O15_06210 [Candidatus Krumholzibacteriota bacterium]|nr:hypothetical protein [Candidatus Krumholzibacteriota bacterium]
MVLSNRGGIRVLFFPLSFLVILPVLGYYLSTMKSWNKLSSVIVLLCLSFFYPDFTLKADQTPLPEGRMVSSAGLGYFQKQSIRKLAEGVTGSADSLRLLAIMVSFPGSDFDTGSETVAAHDSLYFANELRHLKEYYHGASRGLFKLDCDLRGEVIQLSRPEEYYGGDDQAWASKMVEMMIEAVDSTDSEIDFSIYDAFALIHAGPGRETDIFGDSPSQLWSGFIDPEEMEEVAMDTLDAPGIPTDDPGVGGGFYIDNLLILPEESSQDGYTFGSLGIYAYQFAKRLGLVPLYDSTPSGYPDSQGIGNFGLMSYGLYNGLGFVPAFPSAFNRYLMGWVEPVIIEDDSRVELESINSIPSVDTQMVKVNLSPSEYFLIVNRVHDRNFNGFLDFADVDTTDWIIAMGETLYGFPQNADTLTDAEFDFYLTPETNPYTKVIRYGQEVRKYDTGSGLMIWHVDERMIQKAILNEVNINNNVLLKGVDLEEADGIEDLDRPGGTNAFGSHYDSFRMGNNDSFGENTTPSSDGNFGVKSGINITDISDTGYKMNFLLSFGHLFNGESVEFEGLVRGHSPIPADVNLSGGIDMIVTADTGLVYLISDAGAAGWTDRITRLNEFPGAVWKTSPVVSDIDGDGIMEIFAVSRGGNLYALDALGNPFNIDVDATSHSLEIPDTIISFPMMMEADGDTLKELLVLSSDQDSVFMNIVGSSVDIEGSDEIGDGVLRAAFAGGELISNPTAFYVNGSPGFLCLTRSGSNANVCIVRFGGAGDFSTDIYGELHCPVAEGSLLTPSSGDIDGDGSDELVVSIPGTGLLYFSPVKGQIKLYENDNVMSTPSLEDIDGDGILETAAHDRENLFLFTGFGVLKGDWPVSIGDQAAAFACLQDEYSQPLIEDVDGDGECEVIFNIAGNLHAYESDSDRLAGWPITGAGSGLETPAFFKDDEDNLSIFITGRTDLVEGVNSVSVDSVSGKSSAVCYNTGNHFFNDRGWSFYRHDISGSSRQSASEASLTVEEVIDKETFICYPNPVESQNLTVRVSISSHAEVEINILNIEGERILRINRTHSYSSGNRVPFEASVPVEGLVSGIYICYMEIKAGGESWSDAKKFAVVR